MKLRGNRCRCATCGEYFNSPAGFDMHRAGSHSKRTRHCVEPASLGMVRNQAGFWRTSPMPVRKEPVWAAVASGKRETRAISKNAALSTPEPESA